MKVIKLPETAQTNVALVVYFIPLETQRAPNVQNISRFARRYKLDLASLGNNVYRKKIITDRFPPTDTSKPVGIAYVVHPEPVGNGATKTRATAAEAHVLARFVQKSVPGSSFHTIVRTTHNRYRTTRHVSAVF